MLRLRIASLFELLSVPRRLYGLALLRISFGVIALINLISHLREYDFLWGNDGMVPFSLFRDEMLRNHSFSLYMLSPRPSFHAVLYGAQIAIAIAFLLGWRTRWITPLFALGNWSLYQRNSMLLDGGDNLMYLLLFWLVFTDCGARLSLDADRPQRRAPGIYNALISNLALSAMVVQVVLLYGTSALAKLNGPMWQHGTAIYYVLRTGEFNLSPLTPYLWKYGPVVTLLTYSTLGFQILWPFLIWTRFFKLPMAIGALLLHCSIGYFMGLTWFSMVMIGAETIMFSDNEYHAYRMFCVRALRSVKDHIPSSTRFWYLVKTTR